MKKNSLIIHIIVIILMIGELSLSFNRANASSNRSETNVSSCIPDVSDSDGESWHVDDRYCVFFDELI